MEKPVFDVANDNVPADFFLASTHISPEKIAAREALAVAMKTSSVKVTLCKPVDRPEPTEYTPGKRKAANDNREPISWPFLGSLRRAGQHEDARLIEDYRGLCAIMEANPLQGQDIARTTDSMVAEDRSDKLDLDDIEEAAAADWKKPLKSGEIAYKGTRQRAKAPGTVGRAKSTTETTVVKMQDLSVKFSERVLIAQIDMRDVLPRLRRAMGLLVSPFEDAVLGGMTMMEIGEARHYKGKQAEAAGKVLVMTALDAVRSEWADIREGKRSAEEQADMNAERKRTILNARQIAFLMRAA